MTPADANLVALIMAAAAIAFIAPAAIYAYKLRNKITKALLVMAISTTLYTHLFLLMAFTTAISVSHFLAHAVMFLPVSFLTEFLIHITIDSMVILVSLSLFMTFKQAYGLLQEGSGYHDIESKLRAAALGLTKPGSNSESKQEI
jgi:hypothetical protein